MNPRRASINRSLERLAGILRGLRDEGIGLLLVDHDVPFVFDLCDEVTGDDFGQLS